MRSSRMGLRQLLFGAVMAAAIPTSAYGADCSVTSIGFTPINDLGTNEYLGFQGGLYPQGSNVRPAVHESVGVTIARSIVAMDTAGNADPGGKYVLISIGMSNTSQEFSAFLDVANVDPEKDPGLIVINGAQGGATASDWADASSAVWSEAMLRLSQQSVSANQVAVAWVKLANSAGQEPTDSYRSQLQLDLEDVARNLNEKFPNLQLAYFSTRIYAGYASTTLNPEPYAYESGFVMKWIIEKQLSGDATLNFDPGNGQVNTPWLSWGPYMWADGLVPRSDGLIWECSDMADDGTHPSESGRQKVASMLLNFFRTDASAREWYLAAGIQVDTVPPAAPENLIVEP